MSAAYKTADGGYVIYDQPPAALAVEGLTEVPIEEAQAVLDKALKVTSESTAVADEAAAALLAMQQQIQAALTEGAV